MITNELKLRSRLSTEQVEVEPAGNASVEVVRRPTVDKGDGITSEKPRLPSFNDASAGAPLPAPQGTFKIGAGGGLVAQSEAALIIQTPPPPREMQTQIDAARAQLDRLQSELNGRYDQRAADIRAVIATARQNLDVCQQAGWTGSCMPVLHLAQAQTELAAQMTHGDGKDPAAREQLLRENVGARQELVDAFRQHRISFETYGDVDRVLTRADAACRHGDAKNAHELFRQARDGIRNNGVPNHGAPPSDGAGGPGPTDGPQEPTAPQLPQWISAYTVPLDRSIETLRNQLASRVEDGSIDEAAAAELGRMLDTAALAVQRMKDESGNFNMDLHTANELTAGVEARLGEQADSPRSRVISSVAELRAQAFDAFISGKIDFVTYNQIDVKLKNVDDALARNHLGNDFVFEQLQQQVDAAKKLLDPAPKP